MGMSQREKENWRATSSVFYNIDIETEEEWLTDSDSDSPVNETVTLSQVLPVPSVPGARAVGRVSTLLARVDRGVRVADRLLTRILLGPELEADNGRPGPNYQQVPAQSAASGPVEGALGHLAGGASHRNDALLQSASADGGSSRLPGNSDKVADGHASPRNGEDAGDSYRRGDPGGIRDVHLASKGDQGAGSGLQEKET